MTFDIFQLDWITIDIIIILLLILLLIAVEVLKEIFRWRFSFSNVSTVRRVVSQLNLNNHFSSILIKNCRLNESSVFQQEDLRKPTIFIIKGYRKLMLLRVLTEAFCTSGYKVINLRLKIPSINERKRFKSDVEKELHQVFPFIIKSYNQNSNLLEQNFIIIDFTKKMLPLNILLKDLHCRNIILINPCLNASNLEGILTSSNDLNENSKLITIFSEKLNLFFKNKNAKKILLKSETFKNNKHTIVQKAKSTFKYYETLLFSVIIRYLEN
ncbi:MAG: hypothetical protein ACTSQW_00515 [Promethearchaeota archaeon]